MQWFDVYTPKRVNTNINIIIYTEDITFSNFLLLPTQYYPFTYYMSIYPTSYIKKSTQTIPDDLFSKISSNPANLYLGVRGKR